MKLRYAKLHRAGGSQLLSLPNIKEEIEESCLQVLREHNSSMRNGLQKEPERTEEDKRPNMENFYDPKFFGWFVKTFDSPKDYSFYKAMESESFMEIEERYTGIVSALLRAEEPIPISANLDWKEGLVEAHNKYRVKKIVEHLPSAYEQIKLERDLNIQNITNVIAENSLRQLMMRNIANGKRLLGE